MGDFAQQMNGPGGPIGNSRKNSGANLTVSSAVQEVQHIRCSTVEWR